MALPVLLHLLVGGGARGALTLMAIEQAPLSKVIRGRCPRCGEGRLFLGFLAFRDACAICGLDFKTIATDDGPAAFVTLFAGTLVGALGLWVELAFGPPVWVHMLLWLPLIVIVTLALMRPTKAALAAFQYRHKATQDVEYE